MNHSSLIETLSDRLGLSAEEAQERLEALTAIFTENLKAGNQINISSFGLFDVKLKEDMVIIDPSTNKRMLVPPRLEVKFTESRWKDCK